MAASRKTAYFLLTLGALGILVAGFQFRTLLPSASTWEIPQRLLGSILRHETKRPVLAADLTTKPREVEEFLDQVERTEVREFLSRVLAKLPANGTGIDRYQFEAWKQDGKPTQEALALKAVRGTDPDKLMARIFDVDGYRDNIAHVDESRSIEARNASKSDHVRFFQVISVPGVVKIQQELVLVDAGTVKGYRVAYWYLLQDESHALGRKNGARSAFNVGAWLIAPNVVGYTLSSWPERADVNMIQWVTLTNGADALAKKVIEDNIDGLATWARK
jgi:hypothetical protein